MATCPWYVSAAAVRRYMTIVGATDFDAASDALIEYCAASWQRYLDAPERKPRITRTGAYQYRGLAPRSLGLVVVMPERDEGAKPQLVDVLPTHGGLRSRQRL